MRIAPRAVGPPETTLRGLEARCEEAAGRPRGLDEPVAGIVEGDAPLQRLPDAAVAVCEPDLRELVVKAVAGAHVAVPAFGHRLRIPGHVAAGQVDRRAHGLAVEPDPPPRRPPGHLEHLEVVFRARLDRRVELDVPGIRAGNGDFVVDPARLVRRESAVADLNPFGGAARARVGTADADPGSDVPGGNRRS